MKNTMVEATHTEDKVRKYYKWRASNYDAGASFEIEHHAEAIHLAGNLEGQYILEVACGTGQGTKGLAKAVGEKGKIEAIDLSEAMLEQARTKMERLGVSPRVHIQQGNAKELPFKDNTFDLLYNSYMFDLIPLDSFIPILREFERVLKLGGKLVAVNMSKPTDRKTFYEKVYETKLAIMPCRPVLMTPFLERVGFKDIKRYYRSSHGFIVSKLWGTEIVLAHKSSV